MGEIAGWIIRDPSPGIDLKKISSASDRLLALLSRTVSGWPTEGMEKEFFGPPMDVVRVYGAIEMIAGMEYHYGNIAEVRGRFEDNPARALANIHHESTAYLNRVGQFCVFANSDRAREWGVSSLPSTLSKLLKFRNKVSAHRAIDAPWKGDTEFTMKQQALAISDLGASVFVPKDGRDFDLIEYITATKPHRDPLKLKFSTNI